MADFYEEDEPVEEMLAAFDRGEKGLTGRPRGWNRTLNVPWSGPQLVWGSGTTTTGGVTVRSVT